jgi:hypothetical protein
MRVWYMCAEDAVFVVGFGSSEAVASGSPNRSISAAACSFSVAISLEIFAMQDIHFFVNFERQDKDVADQLIRNF